MSVATATGLRTDSLATEQPRERIATSVSIVTGPESPNVNTKEKTQIVLSDVFDEWSLVGVSGFRTQ